MSEGYTTFITIDDREPKSIQEIMAELCIVPIEVKRIETGDYICNSSGNTLIVERKTIADFASSIIDNRLFTQVDRMKKYPRAAIVICGSKEKLLEHSEINYHAVLGAEAWLVSIGISVIREEDPKDCAYLILKLFEKVLGIKLLIDFPPRKRVKKYKPKNLNITKTS